MQWLRLSALRSKILIILPEGAFGKLKFGLTTFRLRIHLGKYVLKFYREYE